VSRPPLPPLQSSSRGHLGVSRTGKSLRFALSALFLLTGLSLAGAGAPAQPAFGSVSWVESLRLEASDGELPDQFGHAVALDGDTLLVGAFRDDAFRGSAYVFVWDGATWTEQAKLVAPDGLAEDYFGYSVAIDGDTAALGAYLRGSAKGAVYMFVRSGTTWSHQATLEAADVTAPDGFGVAVALEDDTVVATAYWDDSRAGSAYVFTRTGTTWTERARLVASDRVGGDNFGSAVALSGGTVAIGAAGDDSRTGATYVFTGSGGAWTQQAKITAADGVSSDAFGHTASLEGDTLAIGAPGDDAARGSTYIVTRTSGSWTQQAKITASNGVANDYFGSALSLDGDSLAVGAYVAAGYQGAAYVFSRSGTSWSEQGTITASNGVANDYFGFSLAMDDGVLAVGALGANSIRGSLYIYNETQPSPGSNPEGSPQALSSIEARPPELAATGPAAPTTLFFSVSVLFVGLGLVVARLGRRRVGYQER
jgi:hypothetical protein